MTTTTVVDARGLRCPAPVLHAARAARAAGPGGLLEVRWTDPAAGPDLAAWARMRGHTLVVAARPLDDGGSATTVRLAGDDDGPAPEGAGPS